MMSFNKFDIHLLSYEEMKNLMDDHGVFGSEVYKNTLEIADKVEDYKLRSNLNLLPVKHDKPEDELRDLSIQGLKDRGLSEDPIYTERLEEELNIIRNKEFGPYFLIVRNMISWAKSEGILVGPGRGSAAGSLVCYCLGITEFDPLKYGLLFSRFINPERSDYPDMQADETISPSPYLSKTSKSMRGFL